VKLIDIPNMPPLFPLTDETSAKAVVYLYKQSHARGSNALDNNVISVDLTKSTDVGLLSSHAKETDRHSKIAKQIKRRRDREPSRILMKKILRCMKTKKS